MKRIDQYLEEMLEKGASDIHLSSNHQPCYRIDGEMHFDGAQLSTFTLVNIVKCILWSVDCATLSLRIYSKMHFYGVQTDPHYP